MTVYEIPPCPNCGVQTEMGFMLAFAREQDFDFEVNLKQLRSLWTACCIRHDYEPDTYQYDSNVQWIWQALQENNSFPLSDDDGDTGYETFYAYMSEEVL